MYIDSNPHVCVWFTRWLRLLKLKKAKLVVVQPNLLFVTIFGFFTWETKILRITFLCTWPQVSFWNSYQSFYFLSFKNHLISSIFGKLSISLVSIYYSKKTKYTHEHLVITVVIIIIIFTIPFPHSLVFLISFTKAQRDEDFYMTLFATLKSRTHLVFLY